MKRQFMRKLMVGFVAATVVFTQVSYVGATSIPTSSQEPDTYELKANIESLPGSVTISGYAPISDNGILLCIYNSEQELIGAAVEQSDAEGNFAVSLDNNTFVDDDNYSIVVRAYGTNNIVAFDYSKSNAAWSKTKSGSDTGISVKSSGTKLSTVSFTPETKGIYFTTSVENVGETPTDIEIMLLQLGEAGQLRFCTSAHALALSGEANKVQFCIPTDNMNVTDHYYMIISDADSGVLLADIENVNVFDSQKMGRNVGDVLDSIPVDEELQQVIEALQNDENFDQSVDENMAAPMSYPLDDYSEPTAVMTMQYGTAYYEGAFKNQVAKATSRVYNPTSSSVNALVMVAFYDDSGRFVDSQNVTSTASANSEKTITISNVPTATNYSTSSTFRLYTWNASSLTPYSENYYFQKGTTQYDNWNSNEAYAPEFPYNSKIYGYLSSTSDVDILTYVGTGRTINLNVSKGNWRVEASNGTVLSNNPTSFTAVSGVYYYIRVTGASGEYIVTIN